ncbi:MAG: hypothetical protein L6R43_13900, partial [Planctomycetes bacterium]|nr:hypothetical protein [Planctomycetota bacterium]
MTPPLDLLVRPATPADAAEAAALLEPLIAARRWTALTEPVPVEEMRAWILAAEPRGIFHLAVERSGGRILGMQDLLPWNPHC